MRPFATMAELAESVARVRRDHAPRYERRDPEATVLHGVFREHLEPLIARLPAEGR